MDEDNQLRRVLRTLFTKDCNTLLDLLETDATKTEVTAKFAALTIRYEKLSESNQTAQEFLLAKPNVKDDELASEFERCSEYDVKYLETKGIVEEYLDQFVVPKCSSTSDGSTSVNDNTNHELSAYVKHKFKPEITKKFDGSIGSWIGFWTQFASIHECPKWTDDDKFDILLRAMKPDSPAQKLIDRFPPSKENYAKAVELLRSRYGKDEYLIEFYVRQLLTLVLTKSETRSISELYDELEVQLSALDSLKVTKERYAAMLFPLVESALPENTFKIWERHRVSKDTSMKEPDDCLSELLEFLRIEVAGEERLKLRRNNFDSRPSKVNQIDRSQKSNSVSNIPTAASLFAKEDTKPTRDISCIFCDKPHSSQDCVSAIDMTLLQRNELLKKKGACFKCLRKSGHLSSKCKLYVKCAVCKGKHFPIMCQKTDGISEQTRKLDNTNTLLSTGIKNNSVTYLPTLVAKILTKGKEYRVRILLDSGSQKSYIIKSCVKKCDLSRQSRVLVRQEVFGGTRTCLSSHGVYNITLKSLNDDFKCEFEVLDQERICSFVPKLNFTLYNMLKDKGIILSDFSDIDGRDSEEVQILLGADSWAKIILSEHVQLESGLIAINTKLGWTLLGASDDKSTISSSLLVTLTCHTHLAHLWDLELMGIRDPGTQETQKEKDRQVKEFFEETVKIENGRYVVKLPWIEGHTPLEDNKESALRRLTNMTRKLRETGQYDAYDSVIQNWISEGIVEIVSDDEITQFGHYLPHRAVIKEGSTTRIRPVFDASNRDRNGNSLNESLEKGPNLIEKIPTILISFRLGKIGVSSDIEKAFLQVILTENDRNYLRFLWWEDGKVKVLRHCRVVFGVSPSPFLLGAVLQHLLERADPELQHTAERLKKSFYVDNCLTSLESESELDTFISESRQLLSSVGFNLRGWVTNSRNVDAIENVLGLKWFCGSDTLGVNMKTSFDVPLPLTRRVLLSIAQRLYDPIGFTASVGLIPKMLLQKSWSTQAKWDDPLPADICKDFHKWVHELPLLENCKLPRRIICNKSSSMHVFCDASKMSFAACVFVRTEHEGQIFVNLIMAKSRVAPTKILTIPRLELMSAILGARLYKLICPSLNIELHNTTFWSDSSVVLNWIKNEGPWTVFVNNRVQEIRSLTDATRWRHVSGCNNPADLISRGCSPRQLLECKWWEGPTWLYYKESDWPISDVTPEQSEIDKERRKTVVSASVTEKGIFSLTYLAEKFSSYYLITKVVMYVLDAACILCPGFIKFCGLNETSVLKRGFTCEKYSNAELILFRCIQNEYFSEITNKSALKGYSVCSDDRGLLHIKTRILDEQNTDEFNTPIILPGKHPLVLKMIEHLHVKHNHAGVLTLLVILRDKFWLLSGRRAVGMAVRKCLICRKQQATPLRVATAPLPTDRTRPSSTFQVSGVDLAGPIFLKDQGKAWIVIFTCAVYRAVHLDLVTSLSTESFMQALRRFIARRGRPRVIYSDNGTNFTGLDNLFKQVDWTLIERESAFMKIRWKFNPPTAAWWGGFWERLIRILKDLLRKNLGLASLTYEEMITLLCECESIMNNRPITYLAEDPSELTALKPSMFLQSLVGNNVDDLDQLQRVSLEKRWRYLQNVREGLKKRFCKEYLGTLRCAKSRNSDSLQVGDIVLIGSENKKRLEWPLAKVVDLLPGRDGVTRLARLKTQSGEILRPLQRLYPLEVGDGNLAAVDEPDVQFEDLHDSDDPQDLREASDFEEEEGIQTSDVDHETIYPQTRSGRQVKPRNILDL